jgi:CheY-like chemotaxis protein
MGKRKRPIHGLWEPDGELLRTSCRRRFRPSRPGMAFWFPNFTLLFMTRTASCRKFFGGRRGGHGITHNGKFVTTRTMYLRFDCANSKRNANRARLFELARFALKHGNEHAGEQRTAAARGRCNAENDLENAFMNATLEMHAPTMKPEPAMLGKRKILLFYDDPAVRQVLRNLLADEDFVVLSAANGGETLDLASATNPDLALLDLHMPDKDGWRIFEQLSLKNPRLPIVLITAGPSQLFSALASGVSALLAKPLNLVKLLDTVHNVLEEPAALRFHAS